MTRQHIADKGPKACVVCDSPKVLRTVGNKGYCKKHQDQAFDEAKRKGVQSGDWKTGNKFESGNSV